MSEPNIAGGEMWALTSGALWELVAVHGVPALVRQSARANGSTLSRRTLDALAVLEAAADAYRPPAVPRPQVRPVGRPQIEVGAMLLSTAEVAGRIGRSDRTVRRLIKDGHLEQSGSVGRRLLVVEESVVDYVARRREAERGTP